MLDSTLDALPLSANDDDAPSPQRAAVGAAPGARAVVVDGVRLTYDDEGRGDAVVCLHALAHGAGDFAGFRARQRDRLRIIALDWPGQGRSAADRVAPSSARYAELLAGALDALRIERAVLLGNSIGGGAALRFAAAQPERVRGVIAANPSGLVPYGLQKRLFTRAVAAFFARGARGARWYPRAFAAMYRGVLSEPPAAEQRDRIIATGREMAPLLAAAWRSFAERSDDLRDVVPRIGCPTLITWSLGDTLNPLRFNRATIARLPHGRLETFAGGHAPFLECPQAFDSAFTRFLAELA
ncbi:MAG: alpha/beta hydrolase [Deltaproteobacteria bacterium]|nr:alpha/beta hydrolase [Deltaproteobacteria bacterium]